MWDRGAHGAGDTARAFAPQHEVTWFATKGGFRFSGRRPTSVLAHPKPAARRLVHPTQKPEGLMAELVASVVPERGIVVDPFMGSGATGCGCVSTNRRLIGIEMLPAYCDLARARISEAELA